MTSVTAQDYAWIRSSWYEAGELRTGFEWPTDRYGSTPDDLVPVMREIGFGLTEKEDRTGPSTDTKAAVLALAERLTGVRLTEELLKDAAYSHAGQGPDGWCHASPPRARRSSSGLLRALREADRATSCSTAPWEFGGRRS
ncbi:DUF6461 domain-containing protein [Streptomyces sp. NPDC000229]|uniref:DUF6461 domain-containing protein n=1 Tax=Streptomyces sp. NPDC000229 TaxID=3154247 RepID=UPI0033279A27